MQPVQVAADAGSVPPRAQAPAYGGGVLPQASPPRGYTPTLGITLRPSGDRLAFRFDTTLRCGRRTYDRGAERRFEARVPVARAGARGLPSSRAVYLGLSAHRLRGGFAAPVIV